MSYDIIRTEKDKTSKIYDFSRVCDCVLAEHTVVGERCDISDTTMCAKSMFGRRCNKGRTRVRCGRGSSCKNYKVQI